MLSNNLEIILLGAGLLLGILALRSLSRGVDRGKRYHPGVIGICFGFAWVLPLVLIRVGVVRQTGATVLFAFIYFFVFVIGTMRVNAKIYKREYSEWRK